MYSVHCSSLSQGEPSYEVLCLHTDLQEPHISMLSRLNDSTGLAVAYVLKADDLVGAIKAHVGKFWVRDSHTFFKLAFLHFSIVNTVDIADVEVDELVPIGENYEAFDVSEHLVRSSADDFVFVEGWDRGAWWLGCHRWVGSHSSVSGKNLTTC